MLPAHERALRGHRRHRQRQRRLRRRGDSLAEDQQPLGRRPADLGLGAAAARPAGAHASPARTTVDAGGTASVEFTSSTRGRSRPTCRLERPRLPVAGRQDHLRRHPGGSLGNGAALANGEQYLTLERRTFKVPGALPRHGLRDRADRRRQRDRRVAERRATTSRCSRSTSTRWPFADLVVHDVKAPAQAFEGNTVEVRYTVTNRGSGATDTAAWTEQIWLTCDKNRPHPGQGDVPAAARSATTTACSASARATTASSPSRCPPSLRSRRSTTSRPGSIRMRRCSRTRWRSTSTRTTRTRSTTTTTRPAAPTSSASRSSARRR